LISRVNLDYPYLRYRSVNLGLLQIEEALGNRPASPLLTFYIHSQQNNYIPHSLVCAFAILNTERFNPGGNVSAQKQKQHIERLQRYLAEAKSYEQWSEIAQNLDDQMHKSSWKLDPYSDIYNFEMLTERTHALRNRRIANDNEALIRQLREGLHHDLGNMGDPRLYNECYIGTKNLIDEYVEEVCLCIRQVAEDRDSSMLPAQKLDFLKAVLLSYGRPALLMSGGASLGAFHMGVVKALSQRDLLPQVVAGSSAGSIITAFLGTHTDDELQPYFDPAFLKMKPWKWAGLWSGVRGKGFMDQEQLKQTIREYVGDMTMQEAYEKTGRSINITVSPVQHHQKERLLSGYTSPYLMVWSAALASCAVPTIFPPVQLQQKDENGNQAPYMPRLRWVDGSVVSDLPIERLMHLYDVNYSIVSQTNPHVVPFMKDDVEQAAKKSFLSIPGRILRAELKFHGSALFDYMRKNSDSQIVRQGAGQAYSVLSQRYRGDVTLHPRYSLKHYAGVLSNPSEDFLSDLMLQGERATWPKLAMINTHAKISKTLEQSIAFLKKEVRTHRAALRVIA
jgi:TAG lipase/steryl ester hydrolase/phospholipase A2/LPA acyltransferase